jgi:hypothetical protein
VAITLVGATVNGALGYGFSSLTVPVALLFYTNRILNPALVLVEVVLNAHVLWTNRTGVLSVWRRVLPIVIGLLPGVAVGTWLVYRVEPDWIKFITYATLAPLILVQAAGIRRPIRSERSAGFALGTGVGVLYAVTTISGPPLALMFNNQGYTKQDFRAGLGFVRLAESSLTATAYVSVGLITTESLGLIPFIVPSILVGIPLGAFIIRRMSSETFRRIVMSFDAWIVAFGMGTVLAGLGLVAAPAAYLPMAVIGGLDLWLLRRYFARLRVAARGAEASPISPPY